MHDAAFSKIFHIAIKAVNKVRLCWPKETYFTLVRFFHMTFLSRTLAVELIQFPEMALEMLLYLHQERNLYISLIDWEFMNIPAL